ncbi:hypothetical protein GGTG_03806 [Gaeumannomyces tritici R3-111a-1]|uniref:Uncharacterized protein n=1 Tax=Gaeumannomyces tritici (strain R3-111a-1) TaxID=644352 RepID=J3NRA2_GAET3|nr:hypothetical protein GGTG_03806 [Gaeumannomyces tritici R3-111a-1]EJT78708.1 hypothetical protein GGTG_03806 [Gaeumannomyces tritici R3-111a-1]
MSSKKVFVTGATGYIGGTVLARVVETFPDLEVTALMRRPDDKFVSRYPSVKIIQGTFDDFDIIERASQAADVVIHMGDIDHAGCAKAILSGVGKRRSETFVVHLSGTGCIADISGNNWEGELNPHVWDDVAHVDDIYDLPLTNLHRAIDKSFQDASSGLVKTVCVVPPDIFGRGPEVGGSRGTYLVPMYVDAVIRHGEAFYLGQGANRRAVTHIDDVASLFVLILRKYLLESGAGLEYGKDGFYFAVSEEIEWKQAAEAICKIGQEQGWLPEGTETASWDEDRVRALLPPHFKDIFPLLTLYIWGSNSRASSTRAKRLGWKPIRVLADYLADDCKMAAEISLARAAKAAAGDGM